MRHRLIVRRAFSGVSGTPMAGNGAVLSRIGNCCVKHSGAESYRSSINRRIPLLGINSDFRNLKRLRYFLGKAIPYQELTSRFLVWHGACYSHNQVGHSILDVQPSRASSGSSVAHGYVLFSRVRSSGSEGEKGQERGNR
jgi:hypothetical protein